MPLPVNSSDSGSSSGNSKPNSRRLSPSSSKNNSKLNFAAVVKGETLILSQNSANSPTTTILSPHLSKLSLAVFNTDHNPTMQQYLYRQQLQPSTSTSIEDEDENNPPTPSIGNNNIPGPPRQPTNTVMFRSSVLSTATTIMDQGQYRPLDASEDADDQFHARLEEEMRTKLKMPRAARLERQRSGSRDANVKNKLQEKIQRNNKIAVEELKKNRAAARKRFVSSTHQSGGDVEAVPAASSAAAQRPPQQQQRQNARSSRGGKTSVPNLHDNNSGGVALARNNSASFGNHRPIPMFSNAAIHDEFHQISNYYDDDDEYDESTRVMQPQRFPASPNATWLSSSANTTNSSGSSGATILNRNDAEVKSRNRQKHSVDRPAPLSYTGNSFQQQNFRQQRSLNTDGGSSRSRQSSSPSTIQQHMESTGQSSSGPSSSYEQRSQNRRRRDLFRKHDRELKMLNVVEAVVASSVEYRSQQVYMGPGLRCIPHERLDIGGTNAAPTVQLAATGPNRRSPLLGAAPQSQSSVDLTQYQKQHYPTVPLETIADFPASTHVTNVIESMRQPIGHQQNFRSLRRGGKRGGPQAAKSPFRDQHSSDSRRSNNVNAANSMKQKSSAVFSTGSRNDLLLGVAGLTARSRDGSGNARDEPPKDEREQFARTLSTLIHVRCSRNRDNNNDMDAAAATALAAADAAYPFGAAQYARRDSRDSGHGSSVRGGGKPGGGEAYRCNVQDVLWLELRSWRHDLKLLEQEQLILEGRREAHAIYNRILSMQTIMSEPNLLAANSNYSDCTSCRGVEAWQSAADASERNSILPHSLDVINANYISCLAQTFARVHELLARVAKTEELYPHSRYLEADIPIVVKPELQGRLQTLYMWYNNYYELSIQLDAIADIVAGTSRRRSEVFPKLSRELPRNLMPTTSIPLSSISIDNMRPVMTHSNSTVVSTNENKESDASGPPSAAVSNQPRAQFLRSTSSVVTSSGVSSPHSSPSATPTAGFGSMTPLIDAKTLQQFTPPGISRQQTTANVSLSSTENLSKPLAVITPPKSIVVPSALLGGGSCVTIGNGEAVAMSSTLSMLNQPFGSLAVSHVANSGGAVSPATANSSTRSGGHPSSMLRAQSTPNDSLVRKKSTAEPTTPTPTAAAAAPVKSPISDAKPAADPVAVEEPAKPAGPVETVMSVIRHYLLRNLRRGLPEIVNSFDRRLSKSLSKRLDELRSVAPNGSSYRSNMKRLKLPSLEPILLYLIRLPMLVLQEAMLIRYNQKPSSLVDFTSILQLKSECNEILSIASLARRQYIDVASRLAFNSKHIIEATLDEFDEQFHDMIMLYIEYLSEAVTCVSQSAAAGHATSTGGGGAINKDMLESEWRFVWQKLETMQESNYVLPKAFCEITSQIFLAISDYLSQGMDEFFADLKSACDEKPASRQRPKQQKLLSSQSEMVVPSSPKEAASNKPVSKKPADSKAIEEDTEDEDESDDDDDDEEEEDTEDDDTAHNTESATDNDADDESDLERLSNASVDSSDAVDDIDDDDEDDDEEDERAAARSRGVLLADADERHERLRKRDAYRLFMRRCKLLYNQASERAQDALKFAKVLRKDLEICSIYERNVGLDKFLEGLEGTGHHRVTFSYSLSDWQQQQSGPDRQFSRGLSTLSGASGGGGVMPSNSKSFERSLSTNTPSPAPGSEYMPTPSASLETCMFFVPDSIADDTDLIRQLLSSPVGAQVVDTTYEQGYLLVVPIDEAYHSFKIIRRTGSAGRMQQQQQQQQMSRISEMNIEASLPSPAAVSFARQSSLLRSSAVPSTASSQQKKVEFLMNDDDDDGEEEETEQSKSDNDEESQNDDADRMRKSFSTSTSVTSTEAGLTSISDDDTNFAEADNSRNNVVKRSITVELSSTAKPKRTGRPSLASELSLKMPQPRSLSEVNDISHWRDHQAGQKNYSKSSKPPYHRSASMLLDWKGPTIVIESGSGVHGFAMTRFPMHVHERELQFIVLRNNDLFLKRKDFEGVIMRALDDAVPSAEAPIVCKRLQSPCHSHIFSVLQQLKTKAIDAGSAMLAGISRIEQQHAVIAYALDAAFIDTSNNNDAMPGNSSNSSLTLSAAGAAAAFSRTISLFSSSSSVSGNVLAGNNSASGMVERIDSANTPLSSSVGSMGASGNDSNAAARRGSLQTTIGGGGTIWAVAPTSSASNSSTLQSAHRTLVLYLYDRLMEFARELVRLFTKGESPEVSMFLLTVLRAWMAFVMQRTERGKLGVRPRWAHVGFEFIALAVQAVHTRHLKDDEFSQFKDAVRRCIDHVIGESSEEIENMRAAVGAAMGVMMQTSTPAPISIEAAVDSAASSISDMAVHDETKVSKNTLPPNTQLSWPTHFRSNNTIDSNSNNKNADAVLPVGVNLPPGLTPSTAASMHTVTLLQPQHNSGGGLTIISAPAQSSTTNTDAPPKSGVEAVTSSIMKRYWSNVNDYTLNRNAVCPTSGGFMCNLGALAEEEIAAAHMEADDAVVSSSLASNLPVSAAVGTGAANTAAAEPAAQRAVPETPNTVTPSFVPNSVAISSVTFASESLNNNTASSGVSSVMPRAHRFRHACEQLDRDRTGKLLSTKLIGRIVAGKPETVKHLRSRRVNFRWQRGELVGQGKFGKVFQAVNLDEGRTIAVKCFAENAGPQAKQFIELMKEIDKEMVVLEGLDHENIVKYYGVEVHRDEVCIFMEYCNGGDLAQSSLQGLSLPVIRNYTAQILRGIQYLHENKIIHFDMKGENVLVTKDGELVKIADFNTAVKLRSSMTMTADVPDLPVGTPAFMAPEMINRTSTPGRSADIWSIGCCVVQMMQGKPPFFEMNNSFQVMFAIGQGRPPKTPENAGKDGADFLKACFSPEPQTRPMASDLLHYKFVAGV